ncbi:MAG TPA: hypothetical protein VF676_03855 [Flavobacterium sp.]|jgi:hypothetical protein
MGTLNNGGSQQHNDNRKNYPHSNEKRRDNRADTRDHEYKEHDETLTNDENYSLYSDKIKGDPDFRDKNQNASDEHSSDQAK